MKSNPTPLLLRIKMTLSAGPWVGIFGMLLLSVIYFALKMVSILVPSDKIEKAPEFPTETYKYNRHLLDHSFVFPKKDKK